MLAQGDSMRSQNFCLAVTFRFSRGHLPISLASSEGVTNLQFSLSWPGTRFSDPSLTVLAPVVGGSSLQNQLTNLLISLQTVPGQLLQGTQEVLRLNFATVTN
jgi:hypothetical protein